jgi:hypothetical protein
MKMSLVELPFFIFPNIWDLHGCNWSSAGGQTISSSIRPTFMFTKTDPGIKAFIIFTIALPGVYLHISDLICMSL